MEENKVYKACIELIGNEVTRCQSADKIIQQSLDRIGMILYSTRYLAYYGVLDSDSFDSITSFANTAIETIYRIGVEQ